MSRPKIYQLFGSPGGGLSAKTVDYRGESIDVLAHSVKQAYHLAGNSKWSSGPGDVGIVQSYRRDQGFTLWDGSWTPAGLNIKHGSSWTSTKQAMQDHLDRTRRTED